MRKSSPIYINDLESVNLTEEDIKEAERIENDPQKILALIDLMFLYEDRQKRLPS